MRFNVEIEYRGSGRIIPFASDHYEVGTGHIEFAEENAVMIVPLDRINRVTIWDTIADG